MTEVMGRVLSELAGVYFCVYLTLMFSSYRWLAVFSNNSIIHFVNGSSGGSSTLRAFRCLVLCLSNGYAFSLQVLALYGNNSSIQPVNGSRDGSSALTAVMCTVLCLSISYVLILQVLAVYIW